MSRILGSHPQSTLRQVVENTESTQRQYALRERAIALGWPIERVQVIDCDQGQSGASAADREGFQRLVAEASLGHAGIVLGLEVSRLARNNSDWHRLLEISGLTGTLILDEDGLYDPSQFNDRLLLGLKGTISEAELHVLRARLRGGILNKAGAESSRTRCRSDWSTTPKTGWSWIRTAKSRTHCGSCSRPLSASALALRRPSISGDRVCCSRGGCVLGFGKGNSSGGRSVLHECCKYCIIRGMPALSSTGGPVHSGVRTVVAVRSSGCHPTSGTRCCPRAMPATSTGTSTSATKRSFAKTPGLLPIFWST